MKVWKRVMWILCGVLVVFGVCALITGAVLGIDQNKLHEQINFGPFRVGSTSIGIGPFHVGTGDDEETTELEETGDVADISDSAQDEETYSYSDIRELQIDIRYGTLKIQSTNGKSITVHAQKTDEKTFSAEQSGDKLIIADRSVKKAPGEAPVILIDVPVNYQFDKAELLVKAGTMKLDSLYVDELDAEVQAGVMSVSQKITADQADISVGAGSITLALLDAKEIDFSCDAGKITATLAGKASDYSFDGECGAGTIKFGEESYGMFDHDMEHNGGSRSVDADCGIGTIKIDF
ncbi:MAG: DUF4097 family beta strand repeat-containing protein [Lachnospiraceae bacterium]|nr:DUF4097 family beta strand repeat-containing protein [Lachnospiraceae bacterium]